MKALLLASMTLISTAALAAPPAAMMEVSPEQRKQMAEMHTRAAECLKSTKPMQECREEMMKNAPHMARGMSERWGCPMMGATTQPETKTKTTK